VQNHKIRAMRLLRTALLKRNLFSSILLCGGLQKFNPYFAAGLAGFLGMA
jgi:hypothetical protein